jgi:hypothetical protein
MPAIQQIACFVAVATPLLVIVAINVYLWVAGERDTLLLPGPQRFPRIELDAEPDPQACPEEPAVVIEEPLREAA